MKPDHTTPPAATSGATPAALGVPPDRIKFPSGAGTGVIHRADPAVPNGAACGAADVVRTIEPGMVTCEACRKKFEKRKAV